MSRSMLTSHVSDTNDHEMWERELGHSQRETDKRDPVQIIVNIMLRMPTSASMDARKTTHSEKAWKKHWYLVQKLWRALSGYCLGG